ncbi:MAG: response regulator transcription factor [Bacteroidetes bacterium]|nr:response regulator transcription factor [Bacteroidota bacterium]
MFDVFIIDDDPVSQATLADLLEEISDSYRVTGIFGTVSQAVRALSKMPPDLVFLDMELPDGNGFDVLKSFPEIDFEVVITTVHDSFMLEAIKHAAVDYLLKPVDKNMLLSALNRFEKRAEKSTRSGGPNRFSEAREGKLVISNQQGLVLVNKDDIIRLESEGAYTKIFLSDKISHLTSKNLGHYEEQLNNKAFFRIHNKHLINLIHVKNYIRGEGGQVIMSDESCVDVARRKKEEFLRILGF